LSGAAAAAAAATRNAEVAINFEKETVRRMFLSLLIDHMMTKYIIVI
jgi:hypothetical protein